LKLQNLLGVAGKDLFLFFFSQEAGGNSSAFIRQIKYRIIGAERDVFRPDAEQLDF